MKTRWVNALNAESINSKADFLRWKNKLGRIYFGNAKLWSEIFGKLTVSVATVLQLRHKKRVLFALITLSLIFWALSQVDASLMGASLARLPATALWILIILLTLNFFAVGLRFRQMLAQLGFRLRINVVWRAFVQGQVAGLLPIPLVGQMSGRAYVLASHGVAPDAIAALSVYERGVLFAVSGIAAAMGMAFLMGWQNTAGYIGSIHLLEICVALVLAGIVAWVLGHTQNEIKFIGIMRSPTVFRALVAGISLTLLGHVFILASFSSVALTLRPEIPALEVVAASAVISFLASMPISVNGWGVREVSSIVILGPLGFSTEEALTVSILVGVAATGIMLIMAGLTLPGKALQDSPDTLVFHSGSSQHTQLARLAAWAIGSFAAFLVFFQFHANFDLNIISLNFADPLAFLGLAVVLINTVHQKRLPQWRIANVNSWIIGATAVLIMGFVIGAMSIGITSWALSNRLLGWLLLMGYAAMGAWLVQQAGRHALRRLTQYLTAVAVAIIIIKIAIRVAVTYGLATPEFSGIFDGYAANRNAFAFQLLVCMAGILAYAKLYTRHGRMRIHAAALGVVMLGLWLTQSRAGLGACVGMVVAALYWRICSPRYIALALTVTLGLLLGLHALLSMNPSPSVVIGMTMQLQPGYDQSRWQGMAEGIRLWLGSPIFGAGLGVFKHEIGFRFPGAEVIHSTPVWWLAEFGLVGFLVFAGGLVMAGWIALQRVCRADAAPFHLVFLLILVFMVFGLVHDIFMQRVFWFLLGAALALPVVRSLRGAT